MEFLHIKKLLAHLESLAFIVLLIGSLAAVYYPLWVHIRQTPPGTTYTFAEGYLPDYYQYLGWVKDGMMGKILVASRFTEVAYPPSLVHTVFPLTGMAGSFFGLPSYASYTLLRLIANIVFLFAFAYTVRKVFRSGSERSLAYIFLLVITGIWSLDSSGRLAEAVPWIGNFNIVGKFFLPPHHLLSLSFLMFAVTRLFTSQQTRKNIIIITALTLIGGFLNPSLLTFFTLFLALTFLISLITTRPSPLLPLSRLFESNMSKRWVVTGLTVMGVSGLVLAYNSYLFQTTMPWSRMYTLMRGFNPPVTFLSYVYAVGPVIIPAIFACTKLRTSNPKLLIFVSVWAFLPFAMFRFLGRPLPMNASRLFQSYQYIPLAILAGAGSIQIAVWLQKLKIPVGFTVAAIIAGFILYGITPFLKGLEQIIEPVKPWYFNEYVPDAVMRTFSVLDVQTPPESVVLASEAVSTMLPAFTHNRVLMGRDDVAPDYYEKRDKAFAMLDGRYSDNEARQFLQTYKVKYILFGLDAQQYRNTTNPSLPFLKEIYTDGDISLVEVTL